jgi:hypothetical protein
LQSRFDASTHSPRGYIIGYPAAAGAHARHDDMLETEIPMRTAASVASITSAGSVMIFGPRIVGATTGRGGLAEE